MKVVLSRRLQALADMVTLGNRVADVGCDHGFLSIYLVQNQISPRVLAMDVREGPLARAKEHIARCGLGSYIETRLSDGLSAYEKGEAQTLVCAGMGGRGMTKILASQEEKAKSFSELILQPQSEIPQFRRFLQDGGYKIQEENILCEEGKYYFMMKAVYTGQEIDNQSELFLEFGEKLLEDRNPVLREYLEYRLKTTLEIEKELNFGEKDRAKERLCQVRQERKRLLEALSYWE